jgi:hypothetical protein
MPKKIQYLALTVLLAGFILITDNALAAGSACGDSGQGKCVSITSSCGPYDEVISSNNCISQTRKSILGTVETQEQCCVPTACGFNNAGIGKCESQGSTCDMSAGYVGLNTSDCLPPQICCVMSTGLPGSQVNPNPTTVSPGNTGTQSGTNPFTGQPTGQSGDSGGSTWAGLVTCQGTDCTLCDFLKFLQGLIVYFTELIFALAGGFIVWGAVEIMTSGGSEERVKAGRERVTMSIYGIAIALVAFLFVGSILQVLTNSKSAVPWNEINCSTK